MRRFDVIIATHNRSSVIGRAIESVLTQGRSDVGLIVVDDASQDSTSKVISAKYPMVKLVKLPINVGPCNARNAGLAVSEAEWAIMLDDDDEMLPGSLDFIESCLDSLSCERKYPVVNFATTNSKVQQPFLIAAVRSYFDGTIAGDYVPVIHTATFSKCGFRYPNQRIGGESLLWVDVARQFGIPTFGRVVVKVNQGPARLTSGVNQVRRAAEYAAFQDECIARWRSLPEAVTSGVINRKVLAAAVYWLMAGNRQKARQKLSTYNGRSLQYVLVYCMTYCPVCLVKAAFLGWRRLLCR